MKICSWNINSVRLRLAHVLRVLEVMQPDVLCLQETKCPDEAFPFKALRKAGYEHIHVHGMKSFNGLAIISKRPFESHDIHHRCGREDCRHTMVKIDGMEIHNLYIPAGGDEPDPALNPKFAHKLDFVDEMTAWLAAQYTPADRLVVLGDFNIAPYEHDVWSTKQLQNVVSHTPPERERLAAMRDSLNFTDAARRFIPMNEKSYSWWSYRSRDWKASNRGRRLDHIWMTPPLAARLEGYAALNDARGWDKPSDHVPIIATLS